ncbi:hypothetical protein WR25_03090 [Diploscapter pachys]|uniref:Uncharacterized protein n=1 Tax=Diploscapter pachys TaxID=2018661 RepID=A0A2A2L5Y9_9BILA|nr:hypothetical protein WR25_03090 [Diploscapter pachys]
MKELRLRLREAFYAHTLNKHSNKPFEALSALDYENWLIEQYFSKSLKRDSVPSSSVPDTAKTGGTVPSHKMTIALETYTIGPDTKTETIEKAVSQISKAGLPRLDDTALDPSNVDALQKDILLIYLQLDLHFHTFNLEEGLVTR